MPDASHSPLNADTALYSLHGMWCTSCAQAVESVLARHRGVTRASVNYATATVHLSGDAEAIALETLAPRVRRLGYRLVPLEAAQDAESRLEAESRRLTLRLAVGASFGMWTMLASLLIYAGALPGTHLEFVLALVSGAFAVPVVSYAGWPFYRAGWRTLRAARPGMDALISLGVLGAVLVSVWLLWRGSAEVYFDTAVMLILLLLVGRLVETLCRYRGLRELSRLYPRMHEVEVLDGDTPRPRALGEVALGERVRVDAGELVPLDGVLESDRAWLDLSPLNGEARAVSRQRGAALQAGSRNLGEAITLLVTARAGEGYLDRLHRQMLELHARKGELQRLADRFAAWLSPLAVVLAVMTLGGLLLAGVTVEESLVRALSVLVVACPCAVGLAIPLANLAAGSQALRHGVVFRDLAAFESLGQVRSAAFDKTGTLTRGEAELAACHPAEGVDEPMLLRLAAQAEWGSEHPLGLALRQAADQRGLAMGEAPVDIAEAAGGGRRLVLADGARLWIGEPAWLAAELGLPAQTESNDESQAGSRVAVARDGEWLGELTLRDCPDAGALAPLAELRRAGMTLALVSGDRAAEVAAVGEAAGFARRECFASQSPEAKARLMDRLPRPSLFVGDGVNDVLALATADVGMAPLGASQPARDGAAVQLLEPGVAGVVEAWQIARRARRIMRQNLALSAGYNLVALGLVVWIAIPPLVAVLAMAASSLSVTANAARLGLSD
ncbi:Cu2+-exporting ATPase/Cu+-exporting ATPase [Franzmannia pantelleriensis]|uniref:Cu2+-exporting ATPase/Cu+-exporting ATPase n=1 Tax=Franzmannia pantelleriensis TaxID=48727 RepID=A0A1G9GMA5_9GAMM|nr:cation-translocating P-type ATPase [Halomonas pantelleriensis]SDL01635.1 Cu2+-exporting ATPase/Cu+-exporting ATPase [Halomonas pantelleriensis]